MEQQQIPPPWAEDLRYALRQAQQALRAPNLADLATAAIEAARAAGWDGSAEELWRVAGTMNELDGSLKQHPQRAYLDREVARYWGASG
ncbi:MAG TPA: hypothetical protein VFI41_04830 [Gemmatimonadales bacterium]|nr:hypothetical protein [Gemmatimonadales bacterium]